MVEDRTIANGHSHRIRHPGGTAGMALMPMVLVILIAGALVGVGTSLIGPAAERMRVSATRQRIDRATRAIVGWSVAHGRLPTDTEFGAAAGYRNDLWHRALVYTYDGNLADSDAGGLCGRRSTGLTVNGRSDAAFFIASGGSDFNVDSLPNTSGAHTGNAAVSVKDVARIVSLAELGSLAGCQDRTTGRLILLNNELPGGCSTLAYDGDLYGEGGVPPYTWSSVAQPVWMTLTPAGSGCHLSGTPPAAGSYTMLATITDSAATAVTRHFDILVDDCGTELSPVSRWEFDEGGGTIASDTAGTNSGTLIGDTGWTTDTPDGSAAALVFDGDKDYVRVADNTSLHLAGELTLMAWVNETAPGQFAKVISRRTGYHFYFLGVDNGHPYGGIGEDASYSVTGKSLLMSQNRWNHLTMVFDDAIDRMFLHFDGTERETALTRTLPYIPGVTITIGADFEGNQNFFDGDIDDVAVYNRVLTDSEIRGLYYSPAHSARIASWGFNGKTDDGSGNGHDGIMVGGQYTTDRFGHADAALSVDGGSFVRVVDHPDFWLTGSLTLAAWIRERTPGSFAKIISRRRGDYFYFMGVDNGRPYGGIGDGGGYTVTRKSIAMLPDQWHFVAFVFDDDQDRMQIYFNGTLDETTVTESLADISNVDLTIGADYEGTRHFFTGSIDAVAVYDQALTVEQIRSVY